MKVMMLAVLLSWLTVVRVHKKVGRSEMVHLDVECIHQDQK